MHGNGDRLESLLTMGCGVALLAWSVTTCIGMLMAL